MPGPKKEEAPGPETEVPATRYQVFVSYCREDQDLVARLLVHLQFLKDAGGLEVWSDHQIEPGEPWREEIEQALGRARVGLLLVSIDFLNSKFINEVELPYLLQAAKDEGVKIVPVMLRPCKNGFKRRPELVQFQTANDPEIPIVLLPYDMREVFWDGLASTLVEHLRQPLPDVTDR